MANRTLPATFSRFCGPSKRWSHIRAFSPWPREIEFLDDGKDHPTKTHGLNFFRWLVTIPLFSAHGYGTGRNWVEIPGGHIAFATSFLSTSAKTAMEKK
ncbi:hypothetical protein [Desulfobulbus propionicus]